MPPIPPARLRLPPLIGLIIGLLVLALFAPTDPALARETVRMTTFHDTDVPGLGAAIAGPADVAARLQDTPRSFRRYVGREGLAARTTTATCDTEAAEVHVIAYTSNRFAAGVGSPCGGHWGEARVIIGRRHHHWRVLLATQDAWDCRLLRRYAVPRKLIRVAPAPADATHNCYDYTAQQPGHYRAA